jgi:hypothetical protein
VKRPKLERLSRLDEKGLRELLVVLLSHMEFKAATVCHGSRELGKDIVCYSHTVLGDPEYLAVVAKAVDLTGSVGSSQGLREVQHQIQQCFENPYTDLFGMKKVSIDRVWVVTSRRILEGAKESVFESLRKYNLAKLTRFISGENLVSIIDKFYPTFWDETLEPADVLALQKNRLFTFARSFLTAAGGTAENVEATLNQVVSGPLFPQVAVPATRELVRLSPYKVEVDVITGPVTANFCTKACGPFRDAYFETKASLYKAMSDLEDAISGYEDAIRQSDPRKFIQAFKYLEKQDYYALRTRDFQQVACDVEALESGLEEAESFATALKEANRLTWATSLLDSVRSLKGEIMDYLDRIETERFSLGWQVHDGDAPFVTLQNAGREAENESTLVTEHTRDVRDYDRFGIQRIRRTSVNDILPEIYRELHIYISKWLPNR